MSTIIHKKDLESLPVGTKVFVKWSGGNGPWEYVLQRDRFGNPWFSTDKYPTVVVGFPSETASMEVHVAALDDLEAR